MNVPKINILTVIVLLVLVIIGTYIYAMSTVSQQPKQVSKLEQIKQRGKLIVGTSADWPPYEYIAKNGSYAGFDIIIAKRIAEYLNVSLEIKDMKFAELIAAIQGGQIDMAIAGMAATAAREKVVDFSIPYLTAVAVIMVPQVSPIKTINDLYGKKVGVQLGSIQEEWAKDNLEKPGKATVISYNLVYPDMILALKRGDVDAIIINNLPADAISRKDPSLIVVGTVPGTMEYTAIALPKGASDFKLAVDTALEQLRDSGKLDQIISNEVSAWLFSS
ncbi:MAG: ABC transporter substrate-binding protein [Thermoprotei archaeon]